MTPQWADLKAKWDNDPEVIEEVVRLERAEAVEAYAARLREAVERLPLTFSQHSCWDNHEGLDGAHLDGSPCHDRVTGQSVSLVAVLDLIKREKP